LKKIKKDLEKYNKRLNNLEQKIFQISSMLSTVKSTFSDLAANTSLISERIRLVNHNLNTLLGLISEFAIIGNPLEKRLEEVIISPKNGVIHLIDNQNFALSKFVIYDKADNRINLGDLKKQYYNDIIIKENFITHKQKIYKNSKIAIISYTANVAPIKINNDGNILNLDKINNGQGHVKEGEELFLFKGINGNIIRFLAPITGLFNTEYKIGDSIKSGDQIFSVYIQ